jgi:hypothetical protein
MVQLLGLRARVEQNTNGRILACGCLRLMKKLKPNVFVMDLHMARARGQRGSRDVNVGSG